MKRRTRKKTFARFVREACRVVKHRRDWHFRWDRDPRYYADEAVETIAERVARVIAWTGSKNYEAALRTMRPRRLKNAPWKRCPTRGRS
jgi:hypothetical protein